MKELHFRPLRRIKKTGKISTPTYMGWNRIRTADYNEFKLVIDTEYQSLPDDEFVYDHKGELLFFLSFNPHDIPIYDWPFQMELEEIRELTPIHGLRWRAGSVSYNGPGMDCQGTPTFSHLTADYLSSDAYFKLEYYEPLTVGQVKMWYGWFLLDLQNAKISQKD